MIASLLLMLQAAAQPTPSPQAGASGRGGVPGRSGFLSGSDPVKRTEFSGRKMSVSLGFLNATSDGVFPGYPYVDFVIRF